METAFQKLAQQVITMTLLRETKSTVAPRAVEGEIGHMVS